MSKSRYDRENQLLSHYEKHLKYYSPIKSVSYFNHIKQVTRLKLDQYHNILDIGCGDGLLSQYIGSIRYTGVDYSPSRIRMALKNYNDDHIEFVNDCVREYINRTDKQFDLVFAFEFLEHIVDPYDLIEQIKRSQRKCTIIATVPINLPREVHLSVWKTEDEVRRDLSPDFIQIDNQQRHFICMWK
jgi:2-polyprenyl-3-methyl-5-hydroxy-6-metoxy-1,4-benzoquinol methylase